MMDLTETMDLTEGTKLTERFLKNNRTQILLHVEGYSFLNSKYNLPEQLLLSQICI